MFISKRKNGIWYVFWFDENGRRCKTSTGTKLKSEALKFLSTFNPKRTGKENTGTQENTVGYSPLLSGFMNEFIEYSNTIHTIKTTQHHRTALREFIRIAGDRRLNDITVRDIERFIGQKKTEASNYTAIKYLSALRSSFETAVRWKLITENQFLHVSRPKVAESRPVYFTAEQFEKLLKVIYDPEIRDISILAVSTGMRLSEIINLRWQDVDFNRRLINIVNRNGFTTKTKKNRSIPINRSLLEVLVIRENAAQNHLVFHDRFKPWRDTKLSKKFKDYVRKAKLPEGLRFHSLRHTFASWLVQRGVSLYEVSRLLGHSTVKMSEKYAHLQTNELHDTINKIAINV